MRVLICGDRNWTDVDRIKDRIMELYNDTGMDLVVIAGGCRGADKIAEKIAKDLNLQVLIFPAEWDKFGRAAGPIRNRQMLVEGKPDMVIAFHPDISTSKGTKDMVDQALRSGIPCEIVSLQDIS